MLVNLLNSQALRFKTGLINDVIVVCKLHIEDVFHYHAPLINRLIEFRKSVATISAGPTDSFRALNTAQATSGTTRLSSPRLLIASARQVAVATSRVQTAIGHAASSV